MVIKRSPGGESTGGGGQLWNPPVKFWQER